MTRAHALNLRHLRILITIAELGSLGAAARGSSISQPALTQALCRLEFVFGTVLFRRNSAGVVVTPDGERVIERVERALRILGRACRNCTTKEVGGMMESYLSMAHVRALIALAGSESFSGAAVVAGVSAPSVHRAVRDLERIAKTTLVVRRGRGVELTQVGVDLARGFMIGMGELISSIDETHERGGHLSIGAMALSRSSLLPATLADLLRVMPDVTVDVVEGSYLELVELLRDGRIDFLIGALRDHLSADLVQEPLFEDSLTIIGRGRHPLAGTVAGFDELAAYPWIVARRASGLLDRWQQMFDQSGKPRPVAPIQCGSVALIRGVLTRSDFLTLLSIAQVAPEIAAGTLVRINSIVPDTMRTIGAISRRDWFPTKLQLAFRECLKRTAQVSDYCGKT